MSEQEAGSGEALEPRKEAMRKEAIEKEAVEKQAVYLEPMSPECLEEAHSRGEALPPEMDETQAQVPPEMDAAATARARQLSDIDKLSQEVEKLKYLVEENIDKAVRAQAELDNLRKRTSRDIERAHKYALEGFVSGLLPVIDSMVLGINASESAEDVDSLREGMDLTLKMFLDTLDKFGVAELDPQGEKFNPDQHEAVSMQEAPGIEPGQVVAVMQKGYELNGRLVRPAMVMVSK